MDPTIWVALIGGASTVVAGLVGLIATSKQKSAERERLAAEQEAERQRQAAVQEAQRRAEDFDRLRTIIAEQRDDMTWRDGEIARLRTENSELRRRAP